MPALNIHLLGNFLLVTGEDPVTTLTVPRLQSLFAYLVLHRAAPQDRSHLAFLLWPDSTEAQAHTNLRKLLYQLRQAFPGIDHFLRSDKQSLQWQTPPDASWTLDVLDFEQTLAQTEQAEQAHDTGAMQRTLAQAMQLYRGDLLPSCYDEWILPERDRLHQLFLRGAERLIVLQEQERDYEAAIPVAQQLLRHDPLHETTYRQLMRLYALSGDRAAALRVYHTCARLLERDLGTEPSEATRSAYESLVQSEAPVVTSTGPLAARGTEAPLVGRKAEWQQLQAAWRKATNGRPSMLILSGEAGIGKTRLAEEMEAWASRQGIVTASARCYAAEGRLVYAPISSWLRTNVLQTGLSALEPLWLTEIARLVPDLLAKRPKLPPPAPITEEWQRQRFFEALAHALLAGHSSHGQPLLLLLDDLQWCDLETLAWLHYLLHFEPNAHLLLVATVRSEEMLPEHSLVASLRAWQREDLLTEIALRPLTATETASLAERITGHRLNAIMSDTLYRETEGNPLFVVEMARAGAAGEDESSQPLADKAPSLLIPPASTLPPTVQSVLSTRLAQLSPLAREVANVAAVIGHEFSFVVLSSASGQSEDAVVQGLDELWQRRIVREQNAGTAETYDFSHDKLREQAYASLSPARRRRLHRRVAEAFEALSTRDRDSASGQIAAHYERAGLPARAIPYYRRAGETALRIYANSEAITAFQRAAALLEAGAQEDLQREQQWEEAAAIYAALGDIFATTGNQQEARAAYQRAMTHVPAQEYLWQARLLRKTATTWNLASDNPLDTFHVNARQVFQEAERMLAQAETRSDTEWIQEWIQLQIDQLLPLRGSVEEMTAIIEQAQTIVEQHGTAEQRGQFFQAVVARDSKRDRYVATEETIAHCRDALAALLQTGNQNLIGFAHFVLGNRLLWIGRLDEAEEEMRTAIQLAEQIGSTRLLSRCLMIFPLVFRQRGQVEEVRAIVTRALALPEARNFAIIKGHQAWIAWRDGNLAEAERYGRASLEEMPERQGANAFQWIGIWPLIGVALAQERLANAMEAVRLLLAPIQQPPPEALETLLEAALQAWDAGKQQEAQRLLAQAVPVAETLNYL